jgi:hypothetical protein
MQWRLAVTTQPENGGVVTLQMHAESCELKSSRNGVSPRCRSTFRGENLMAREYYPSL